MGQIRSNWLTCKKCNRRGKYDFNTKDILYDYGKKEIILNWNLSCKFCKIKLKLSNLTDSSVSTLYCLIIIRNIDGSI